MSPEAELDRDRYLAERSVKQWLRSIVIQGRRCESANVRVGEAAVRLAHAAGGITSSGAVGGTLQFTQLKDAESDLWTEEHFYLIALAKSLRWLQVLARHRPEDRQRIKHFRKSQPHATDVRDMREHDDEYLRGAGRRRARLHHPPPPGSGIVNVDVHATDTLVFEDQYLLGGRVDVRKTIADAELLGQELYPTVSAI